MEICLCDGGEEGGGHKGGVCDKYCGFIIVKIIDIVIRLLSKL